MGDPVHAKTRVSSLNAYPGEVGYRCLNSLLVRCPAVGDEVPANECTGFQDSMSTGAVDVQTQIELSFQDPPEDGSRPKKPVKMSPVFA